MQVTKCLGIYYATARTPFGYFVGRGATHLSAIANCLALIQKYV